MAKPAEHGTGSGAAPTRRRGWRRALPLILLIAGLLAFFAFGLQRYLSFDALRAHRGALLAFVAAHGVLAAAAFMAIYALAVAFSVPGGAIMTLAGGFLFGAWLGTAYVVIAATIGAVGLFLAARSAGADVLRARAGPWIERLRQGFRDNAFSYLLFLRLLPVFPFWLVNLVPAFAGMPLRSYALATLIGIVPGTLVYASLGSGLGKVFDAGEIPDLGIIFRPEILLPLAGLAVLSLAPAVYKAWRGRAALRGNAGRDDR